MTGSQRPPSADIHVSVAPLLLNQSWILSLVSNEQNMAELMGRHFCD